MVLPWLTLSSPYLIVLGIDLLIAVLFATSLHFIMGPGGMHSFGHAAYFGLGAYGAALLFKSLGLPMELALVLAPAVAGLGACLFGWFSVRLSGVYLAMLTLAFAQMVFYLFISLRQYGGEDGINLSAPATLPYLNLSNDTQFYYLVLGIVVACLWLMH